VSGFVRIPSRFNGPLGSGNGGYSSGVIAGFVEGPAEVSLRSPVPLERPLEVIREDGGSVHVVDGEILVAEGAPAGALDLDVPPAVTPQEARVARSRYQRIGRRRLQSLLRLRAGPRRRLGRVRRSG
jgi:hypothetical protein